MEIINKNKTLIYLGAIFITALILRLVKLSEFPAGFQIDEAILGYTGYSLIQTLKETNGVFLPLYTEVFGDYIPTGYHYLTIPSILIFGLTEFATRLPGAIFGALTVFPVYFLAQVLFKNKIVSLLSALFLAISPWNLILSRGSSEAVVSVFFVLSGFAFFIHSLVNQKIKSLIIGAILLSLSFFFYHTPRLFVPIMLAAALVYFFPEIKSLKDRKYKRWLIGASGFIFILVAALVFTFKGSTARFNQISIFSFPETRLVMEEQIREDGVSHAPLISTRVFHNKIVNNAFAFIEKYAEHLSVNALFVKPGLPRMFSIPNVGVIYLTFLPFFFYGLIRMFQTKDKLSKIAIVWILIAPITAALTVDDVPNMRRASVLFPMVEIVSVYGLVAFVTYFKSISKFVLLVLILMFAFNFLYFEHQYFIHGTQHRPWYRNNGFSGMMELVNKNYKDYDRIITTKNGGGFPLFLFYSKYDPLTYQNEGSPKDKDFKGFGKYFFVPENCPFASTDKRIPRSGKLIFIEDGTCEESVLLKQTEYEYILREDGTKAFRVVLVNDDEIFTKQ